MSISETAERPNRCQKQNRPANPQTCWVAGQSYLNVEQEGLTFSREPGKTPEQILLNTLQESSKHFPYNIDLAVRTSSCEH